MFQPYSQSAPRPSARPNVRALAAARILATLAVAFVAGLAPPDAAADGSRIRPSVNDRDAHYRRFLWVTRWDFRTPQDVRRIFENAASAKFTDVFFQVRGEGTVFFKSPYEPWAGDLNQGGPVKGIGVDPGWDPLETAIREARRSGLRIHAWVNAIPAWNQKSLPASSSGHLTVRRKSWLMCDADGRAMTANGFYACLEPGLPEVRRYLAGLFGQLARDYDVDGVHLDYIRYPTAEETKREFWYHPRVVEAFRKKTGKAPSADPEGYAKFRQDNVTATVAEIRAAVAAARPGAELSAAVLADRNKAMTMAAQDAVLWLDRGLIDAAAPMNYVRNDLAMFAERNAPYLEGARRSRLWTGVWPRQVNAGYMAQARAAADSRPGGVAVFCYEELFPGHKPSRRAAEFSGLFASGPRIASAPSVRPEAPSIAPPHGRGASTATGPTAIGSAADARRYVTQPRETRPSLPDHKLASPGTKVKGR